MTVDIVNAFTVVLPMPKPPLLMNQLRSKTHWNVQRKAHAEVKDAVWVLCRQRKIALFEQKVIVQLTWYAKGMGRKDPDGLGAMVKGALDGLTAAKVLRDDSSEFVDEVRLRIQVGATDPRVELTVTEVAA